MDTFPLPVPRGIPYNRDTSLGKAKQRFRDILSYFKCPYKNICSIKGISGLHSTSNNSYD